MDAPIHWIISVVAYISDSRIILIVIPIFISYFISIQVYKKQHKISEKKRVYDEILGDLHELNKCLLRIDDYDFTRRYIDNLYSNNLGVPGVEEEIKSNEKHLKDLEAESPIEFKEFSKIINNLKKISDTKSYLLDKNIFDEIKNFTENFFITKDEDPDWYTDERIKQIEKLRKKIKKKQK